MLLSNIFYLQLDTEIIEHEDMNATGKSCPVAFFSLNPPARKNQNVSKTPFT